MKHLDKLTISKLRYPKCQNPNCQIVFRNNWECLRIESSFENLRAMNHCVKRDRVWSYSGLHFPALELNTERYSVSLRIQSKYGKMRTRITPNSGNFHAVE